MADLWHLKWQDWRQLLRLRLTLMVSASTAVGHLIYPFGTTIERCLAAVLAVACLCSGCTILNQIQERDLDARMVRTADRPLASGQLSVRGGLLAVLLLSGAGFGLLWLLQPETVWLGLFSLLWYNGVYTPLKRVSSLAVLPGALCGAVPPLIGWQVAGGHLGHPIIVLVCGLLVLWQIPHFLLLAVRYRDDYRRAGLPVFISFVSDQSLRSILSLWLAAVSVSFVLLPALGVVQGATFQGVAVLLATALGAATWYLGRQQEWGRLFMQLNIHMGLVLLLLVCDRFMAHIW